MTNQEIIYALRCTASVGNECIREKCPFFVREKVPAEMQKEFGGLDEVSGCDIDGVSFAAADRLEQSNTLEWISVKERLPEKHTRVLCYFKYEPESPNVICENLYHGDGSWLGNGNLVTHWMPLPEPPEEGVE